MASDASRPLGVTAAAMFLIVTGGLGLLLWASDVLEAPLVWVSRDSFTPCTPGMSKRCSPFLRIEAEEDSIVSLQFEPVLSIAVVDQRSLVVANFNALMADVVGVRISKEFAISQNLFRADRQ